MIARWKSCWPYVLLALGSALLYLVFARMSPQRVGDGSEYYAMYLSWLETHRPWMSAASFDAYDRFFSSSDIRSLVSRTQLVDAFPDLRLGATADFNHFWFYSLLAAIPAAFVRAIGILPSPHASFLLLHFGLFLLTVVLAYRFFRWTGVVVVAVLTFGSPMLWFMDKVHTEFLTHCLALSAVILVASRRYLPAAFLLALASTQNPSFALVAFFPFVCRFLAERGRMFGLHEVALIVGTALAVLAHPVYYFLRFGVITPQLLAGGAKLGSNLSTFYVWLFDPDLGLMPNWPLGLLLALLAILVRVGLVGRRPDRAAPVLSAFTVWFAAVNLYAHSSTVNLNAGGTPGLARYALWYLPLFFPVVLYAIRGLAQRRLLAYPLVLVFGLVAIASARAYWPTNPERFIEPSRLSRFLQTRLPTLYDPPAEVFIERYSGRGEAVYLENVRGILGPDCHKLMILPGAGRRNVTVPGGCLVDQAALGAIAERHTRPAEQPYFVHLSEQELLDASPLAAFGAYPIGEFRAGNFALGSGWSNPESWGVWSLGHRATLRLPCNSRQPYASREKFDMTLDLQSFGPQTIEVFQGANSLAILPIETLAQVRFALDVNACRSDVLEISITISNPHSPRDLGQSADERKLGIGLRGFTIE